MALDVIEKCNGMRVEFTPLKCDSIIDLRAHRNDHRFAFFFSKILPIII